MNNESTTFSARYDAKKSEKSPLKLFIEGCAEAVGVGEATIRDWALGYRIPGKAAQEALARHLGIPADELFPTK
jgi:transcriptional regulator with XRE-family HTH domain